MSQDLPVIIGTAGHVDHGKTTLIRALTGVDTDRLEEEKRRGMTIDLGFAPFRLPSGRLAGVVDVPGHEKFLKNMLAGAGGIDLVLLVVAADDGVMPQTREHLDILSLLHIPRGLVVVTKTDLVDPELLELAIEDVRDALAGTFLAGSPVLAVSASTGQGIPELLSAIEQAVESTPHKDAARPARLPIDRVFVKQGFGTVVTGTLLAGTLKEGDLVTVEPGGLESRVRGLHVHGEKRSVATAGQRVAINLAGLEKQEIGRGDWVQAPKAAAPSTLIDIQLEVLPDAKPLAHRTRVRFHHGTAELIGRVVLLDRDAIAPGEQAPAQLVLERPAVADFGDRFVLRLYAPAVVVGGGRVIHPSPAKHKRKHAGAVAALSRLEAGDYLGAIAEALEQAGRRPLDKATVLGYAPVTARAEVEAWLADHAFALSGGQFMARATAEAMATELVAALGKFHAQVPWRLGLSRDELAQRIKQPAPIVGRVLAALVERGELASRGRFFQVPTHRVALTPELAKAHGAILARLDEQPLADLEDFAAMGAGDRLTALLDDMVEGQELLRASGGIYTTPARYEAIKAALRQAFPDNGPFTASQARECLHTTRKYIIPFLEFLDSQGVTKRRGDVRTVLGRSEAKV